MKVAWKNDEAGFTLLESLMTVMVSAIIILFLSSGILHLTKVNEWLITSSQSTATAKTRIKGSRQIEWHLFLNQIEQYLENSKLISHSSDIIVVEEESGRDQPNTVKYGRSKTGQRNFARSNSNGYNALLTEIRRFHLEVDQQWLIMNFTFQNGEQYEGRIWVESWKTEEGHEER